MIIRNLKSGRLYRGFLIYIPHNVLRFVLYKYKYSLFVLSSPLSGHTIIALASVHDMFPSLGPQTQPLELQENIKAALYTYPR